MFANLTHKADSPASWYAFGMAAWLRRAPYQALISLIAAMVGALCSWNGPAIWHVLFTVGTALCAAGAINYEAKVAGVASNAFSEGLVIIQAAACAAMAVHFGFEGFQVLFGVVIGLAGAYGLGGWARVLDFHVPGFALLWYSVGAATGLLLYTVWRRPVLSLVSPLLGGFLMSSGSGVFLRHVYFLLAKLDDGNEAPGVEWLPPLKAGWADAAGMLMGHAGLAAVALQAACALCGVVLHALTGNRLLAIACLCGGIGAVGFVSATGFGCNYSPFGCPDWLIPEQETRWLVTGCSTWALISAAAAWRQLGADELHYADLRGFPATFGHPGSGPGYIIVPQTQPSWSGWGGSGSGSSTMLVIAPDDQRACATRTKTW